MTCARTWSPGTKFDDSYEMFETLVEAVGDTAARAVLRLFGGEWLPELKTIEVVEARRRFEAILRKTPNMPISVAARLAGANFKTARGWLKKGHVHAPRPTTAAVPADS